MSFANYKKNRKQFDAESLTKRIEEFESTKVNKFKDERFWEPTVDKSGNGSATIRFLPFIQEDDNETLPWVMLYEHRFKNEETDEWFVDYCPTTKGKDCPVCKFNRPFWKTGNKEDEDIARPRSRKLHYISNILVVKDPGNPDNEGKVFLYKYGTKIYDKIKAALRPKNEDEDKIQVFDMFEGADFFLDIKKVKGFRNYDDSKFRSKTGPICKGDDKEMEAVYNKLHKLQPLVDDSKFKSYEELETKLNTVLSSAVKSVKKRAEDVDADEPEASSPKKRKERKSRSEEDDTAPWEDAVRRPAAKKAPEPKNTEPQSEEDVDVTSEEDLDYYENMVE